MTKAEISSDVLLTADERRGRWLPGVGRMLAEAKWEYLARNIGIGRKDYGTVRYLERDVSAVRDVVAGVDVSPASAHGLVLIERLHGEPFRRYAALGLVFRQDADVDRTAVIALESAFDRLRSVPSAAEAALAVLAVLHVAEPEGPDYDVGYSDPEVPFSIVVGVHSTTPRFGDLRLAESILHECMHLQLTLIEEALPLVQGDSDEAYSPWQGRSRPVRGLLHGLYVFRVVQDFHRHLIATRSLGQGERMFLKRRVELIDSQVAELGDFADSKDLTSLGRRFARALL